MKKTKIENMHIENDIVNGTPTIVFTDEHGVEWVHEEQTSGIGHLTTLVKKVDSFYFKDK